MKEKLISMALCCVLEQITPVVMGVARIFQRGGGGHTDSYRGYSSDCHLNIVSCLLTRRLTKGGHGHPRTPLATPMVVPLYPGWSTRVQINFNVGYNPAMNPASEPWRVETLKISIYLLCVCMPMLHRTFRRFREHSRS